MTIRWMSGPPGDHLWDGGPDICSLFHRPSGQTHFVNAATQRLLSEVLVKPHSLAEAAAALAAATGAASDPDHVRDVGAALLRLEELGLVHRC